MRNPPSFQFYPQDFLSDLNVQSMTDEQVGKYQKLICYCWIEDGLEIGSPLVEGWFKQHPILKHCFIEKDGKYRHPRLDKERYKQLAWAEKSKIGGLHSAEKKRLLKGGSTNGQPKVKQRSSLQSSSSSSIGESRDSPNIGHSAPLLESKIDEEFEKFWAAYPQEGRLAKKESRVKFGAICKRGEMMQLSDGLRGYVDYLKHQRVKNNFEQRPLYAKTFLNGRWREYVGFKFEAPL